MNELTEGHLITLCDEALHTQLTHISLISRYEGGGKEKVVEWLTPSHLLPPSLSPPLFVQIPMETRREGIKKVRWRDC